jgi:REP element-mobilizing transposase RayT
MDPEIKAIRKRRGARLPHWTLEGAAYFVTFRTFDSLPRHVTQELRNEVKKAEAAFVRRMGRDPNVIELNAIRWKTAGRAEKLLDQGLGECLAGKRGIPELITATLFHYHKERYDLHAWCVMPNHVHVVVKPYENQDLSQTVLSWKSWSARHANEALRREGRFWQREYYDRIMRSPVAFEGTVSYILRNPEKAGLRDWAFAGIGEVGCDRVVWPNFSKE